MTKIPTWEEMESSGEYDDYSSMGIEFAKLHVQAALEIASTKADYKECSSFEINERYRKEIREAYPLENIK